MDRLIWLGASVAAAAFGGIGPLLVVQAVISLKNHSDKTYAKSLKSEQQTSSGCEVRHIPLNDVDDFIKTRSPKERDLLYRVSKCEKGEELLHEFGFELSEGFCSALLVLCIRDRKQARISITNVTITFNQIEMSDDLNQILHHYTKREARNLAKSSM